MFRIDGMQTAEFDVYRSETPRRFALQGVESGAWTYEQGLKISEALFARLLPDGLLTAGNDLFVFRRAHDSALIGRAWVGDVNRFGQPERIILDFELAEAHRRTGVGARLLRLLLDECKRRGTTTLRCNIFGSNPEASRLAMHMGFRLSHAEYICNL